MPHTVRKWTREDVLALPDDGNRYELVDGELLVSPSPRGIHQRAVLRLYDRVAPYVRAFRVGVTMLAPADLDLRSGQLMQPDLFVSPLRSDEPEPLEWAEFAVPILVAEVTSPSTARYDRSIKRRRFQRSGVAEYWIVDTDARLVERWTPAGTRPEVVDDEISWSPQGASEALVIDLVRYFRDVWGEDEMPLARA